MAVRGFHPTLPTLEGTVYILGISAFYHDSAACLVKDGEIVAAAQEERFTRKKHDPDFPRLAVEYCLKEGRVLPQEIGSVIFYDKPFLKFDRLLDSYLAYAPKGFRSFSKAMPLWLKQKLFIKSVIAKELPNFSGHFLFATHHQSHAASAFFPSPFERAAVLTLDGVGEWTTASYGLGEGAKLTLLGEQRFPHSLGLLYSAFTAYAGFKVNSGEYKLMGLAPYGEPKYASLILEKLLDLKEDGSFALDMSYFNYVAGLTMTNEKFHALFGGGPRKSEGPLTQRDMDVAASIQKVTEEIVLRMARHVKDVTKAEYLCLAGGVALNCVANGMLLRSGLFKDIYIQPASGDAGGALGAALLAWYHFYKNPRTAAEGAKLQKATYLGPLFDDDDIEDFLYERELPYEKLEPGQIAPRVAELLANSKTVGWFQGRMEFGPRALGGRSILGDARSPEMQSELNLRVKFRESFRPFAPSVRVEDVSEWFELDRPSPYMLLTAQVAKKHLREATAEEKTRSGLERLKVVRSAIPAVTHVDNSARIQTVSKDDHPLYHELLTAFKEKTGCPVIINTSFNVRGEPIVCTPVDAYICFMRTNIEYLVMGSYLLDKSQQKPLPKDEDWRKTYELD